MRPFIHDDFLLSSDVAAELYHGFARDLPVIDYHCHLPVAEIATDHRFATITEIWLKGDHYKWRAMRTNGVPERFCTGDATDREKFEAYRADRPGDAPEPALPLDPHGAEAPVRDRRPPRRADGGPGLGADEREARRARASRRRGS